MKNKRKASDFSHKHTKTHKTTKLEAIIITPKVIKAKKMPKQSNGTQKVYKITIDFVLYWPSTAAKWYVPKLHTHFMCIVLIY